MEDQALINTSANDYMVITKSKNEHFGIFIGIAYDIYPRDDIDIADFIKFWACGYYKSNDLVFYDLDASKLIRNILLDKERVLGRIDRFIEDVRNTQLIRNTHKLHLIKCQYRLMKFGPAYADFAGRYFGSLSYFESIANPNYKLIHVLKTVEGIIHVLNQYNECSNNLFLVHALRHRSMISFYKSIRTDDAKAIKFIDVLHSIKINIATIIDIVAIITKFKIEDVNTNILYLVCLKKYIVNNTNMYFANFNRNIIPVLEARGFILDMKDIHFNDQDNERFIPLIVRVASMI